VTTIHRPHDIAAVLALSGERDQWHALVLAAYRDGYADGRATACVNLAVMEEHREKRRHWNQWWATVRRVIQNHENPSARLNQVMAEIAADQKLVADALRKRAAKPGDLSPLEYCVLNRIRGARLEESEVV
jgi:hypothetical protein